MFLFCPSANAERRKRSHPSRAFGAERTKGQKFLPPNPLPFCPFAFRASPDFFSAAGLRIKRVAGGFSINYFDFLKRLLFVPVILFLPFSVYAPSISSHPSGCPIPPPPIIFFSPRSVQNKA